MEDAIVLDSGSGIDLFCNDKWFESIDVNPAPIKIGTNAGQLRAEHKAHLKGYGDVPFSSKAITNILSLGETSEKYKCTMDTSKDNAIYVHTPKEVVRFGRSDSKLYEYEPVHPNKGKKALTSSPAPRFSQNFAFGQTVEENKLLHAPRESQRAKAARELLAALGSPSVAERRQAPLT